MTSGSVHPFAAWLVRPDAAAGEVAAMAETAVAARSGPRPVRPEAYDAMAPAVYVYRQRTPVADHVGIVCDITPEVFVAGRVLRHEEVQADRVEALSHYLESVPQRVDLVSTMHHAGPVAERAVADALVSPPLLDVPGADGTQQTVWQVPPGASTEELCRELETGLHYIADGHHRVAAALRVWERSGRAPGHGVLCAVYSLGGLRLESFDRWVHGPLDPQAFLTLLERDFEVRPAADARDAARSGSAVYLGGRWYGARFTGVRPGGAAGLDVSLLHALVLDHLPPGTSVEPVRELTDVLVAACDADGGALVIPPAPGLAAGSRVAVVSTDPASRTDIPAWCRMRAQAYVGEDTADDGVPRYWVRLT